MKIELLNVSKRYSSRWVIKKCNLSLTEGDRIGLIGPNGSGKSTLIKMISGYLSPTKGTISYTLGDKKLSRENIYREVSISAPYALANKRLSMAETVAFLLKFKKLYDDMTPSEFFQMLDIDMLPRTLLGELSSGQYQKFCLASAIMTKSSVLLLDEPGSFLDTNAKSWFHSLLSAKMNNRIVVIASNEEDDLKGIETTIDIADFK